jgi:ubiquinone biosynthesis protein
MSTRSELLPPELIAELTKLQDDVRPLPFADVKGVLLQTCPGLDEWFTEFEETPIASASIAQVHCAVLKDGTKVAVKVQRPGIPELIETDLSILLSMAERMDAVFPEIRMYNPVGMVEDFSQQIWKELDFTRDGRNADRMARNFQGVPGVRFPKIYWEYTSARVLVMEYIEGVRIDDAEAIRGMGIDPHAVGVRGFSAYLKMIFEDGFFHGDPHPGNLLVTREGEVAFLDFGIVGVLRPEKRQVFVNLLFALITEDIEMMLKSMEGFGITISEADRDGLRDDLYIMVHDFSGKSTDVRQVNFGLMVNELTATMRRYRLAVPMSLMLLLKVFVMMLDIGMKIDPRFNFNTEVTPHLTRLAESDTLSAAYVKRASDAMVEAVDGMLNLPRNFNLMLKRFSTGTVRLEIVDTDLQKLQMALDRASDKVMIGLVVAALVVGSSLILLNSTLTLPKEVSYLAVFGYSIAVIVGFYAIYHVIFLKFRLER